MPNTYFVDSMHGIGDNIYQLPFVRALSNKAKAVYINTPIPEIYDGIDNLHFILPESRWRTQTKHVKRVKDEHKWVNKGDIPSDAERIIPHYGNKLSKVSIIKAMEENCGVEFQSSLFHIMPRPTGTDTGKLAIIRPTTVRSEWQVTSRAPGEGYINWCARELINAGYYVIAIADCEENKEWLTEPMPPAHEHFIHGELGIEEVLSKIKDADIVVGGSGFIVPACIAAKTPLFLILGGRGGFDAPMKTMSPKMDLSRVHCAIPDNFCRCTHQFHQCDKRINDIDWQFYKFLDYLKGINK